LNLEHHRERICRGKFRDIFPYSFISLSATLVYN
jgi:hypothetical protein